MNYIDAKAQFRGCGCDICITELEFARRERNALAEPVEPIDTAEPAKPVHVKPEKLPKGLTDIRKAFEDFYQNPAKSIDLSSGVPVEEYYFNAQGEYAPAMVFRYKTLEEVTGLKKLGRGNYSDVYAIDETRVLKVIKSSDADYARYVALVRASPKNPYFPKVMYSGTWAGKTVYILERLAAEPSTGSHRQIHEMFKMALRFDPGEISFLTVSDPLIGIAGKLLREHNLLTDFHPANMMYRGDVPVISDPAG